MGWIDGAWVEENETPETPRPANGTLANRSPRAVVPWGAIGFWGSVQLGIGIALGFAIVSFLGWALFELLH